MTYAEKLKDPRWQRRRLEIMNRDDFRCLDCGSESNTLNVHHVIYRKKLDLWEYPDELLLTLCSRCHEARHEAQDRLLVAISRQPVSIVDDIIGHYWLFGHGNESSGTYSLPDPMPAPDPELSRIPPIEEIQSRFDKMRAMLGKD